MNDESESVKSAGRQRRLMVPPVERRGAVPGDEEPALLGLLHREEMVERRPSFDLAGGAQRGRPRVKVTVTGRPADEVQDPGNSGAGRVPDHGAAPAV